MKRLLYLFLILIFIISMGKACIKKDSGSDFERKIPQPKAEENINYPQKSKNVTIDGVDYLQSQAPLGKFGGTFVMSTIGEGPKTFNPFNTNDATSSQFADMMFDGLLSTHPVTGEVIPKLAKSYEIGENGTQYIIHLRHGIKWSDKTPITADDVYFTWNNIILGGFGNTSTRDSLIIDGKLPQIRKIDDYTVEFTLPKPFAPFLRTLSAPIGPKHILAPVVAKGQKYFNSFWGTNTPPNQFVVSGAFKLKQYLAAQRVVMIKNPDYYVINTDNDKLPYLDRLVYLIVGDLNNEVLKFEAKEIDTIGLRGSNVARYKQREANSDYKVYNLGPDTGTMFVAINLNNRKNKDDKFYVNPIKQAWFYDKNFRNALDLALDRTSMVQNIANGLAQPLFTAESLNSIFLNKNLKGYDRNLDEAKKLLKRSGFKLIEKQLYDKFDNKVEFDLATNAGNTEREALGVMVKQDFEDLGIQVNFKPIEFNSLVNKITNTLDYDMVIMGLTGSPLEPHSGINVWNSKGTLHLFNQRLENDGIQDRFPWEIELDEIFDKGALVSSYNERKKYYDRYQEIIYSEKPILYLYSPTRVTAIRKKFQNIYPSPLGGLLYNLEEIYVD